jgi:hypothetical protein
MTTQGNLIRNKAVELLKNNPRGLRYSELMRELRNIFPDVPLKSIPATLWNLNVTRSKEVFKPTRGLFKYRFSDEGEISEIIEKPPPTLQEEDFYETFANWLKSDLGECSEAIALGGNYLGKKWGTPDVIGIYKPSTRDVIKFQPEIISAEIKINPSEPVTAFGQAIAYRLFSSKVYLVEPSSMIPEDQDRIEGLCILFGVGLILFDLNPESPNFRIRVRAQRYNPDMFYVNEFADKLFNARKDVFNRLF